MAEEINKTYTSNSLYNDSTGVIAFAEQLKQELINWANYQHVTEELGPDNRPDTQNALNNLFLSVYERFLTFLNDADATEEAINTWKEIENFLADYTDEKTLAEIVAELNANIESRLTVPLESTTGSSTTSTMTQKAITETIDASSTFTTGEKVKNVGIDNKPTAGSNNLVKSGGILNSITKVNPKVYFIGKGSSLSNYVDSNTVSDLISGHTYRVLLQDKHALDDITGTSIKFKIIIKDSEGNTQEVVSVIAFSNLNDYYDITMPDGYTMLYLNGRATAGVELAANILDITTKSVKVGEMFGISGNTALKEIVYKKEGIQEHNLELYGKINPSDAFEFGRIDFYQDPPEFTESNSKIRTAFPIYLMKGDVFGLSDYNGKRYYFGYYDENNILHNGGSWKSSDTEVTVNGWYYFLIREEPEATITNVSTLASLFKIIRPSKVKAFDNTTYLKDRCELSGHAIFFNNYPFKGYLNADGEFVGDNVHNCSDYIKVEPSKRYRIGFIGTGSSSRKSVCYYYSDDGISYTLVGSDSITGVLDRAIPSNCNYIRLCYSDGYNNTKGFFKGISDLSLFERDFGKFGFYENPRKDSWFNSIPNFNEYVGSNFVTNAYYYNVLGYKKLAFIFNSNDSYGVRFSYYDENYNYISSEQILSNNPVGTVPSNACFFKLSVSKLVNGTVSSTTPDDILDGLISIDYAKLKFGGSDGDSADFLNLDKIYNVAHRANSAINAPENSVHAVYGAATLGVDSVECDVRLTSDNVPYIMHDITINRTMMNLDGTDIAEPIGVSDLTWEQLTSNYVYKTSIEKYKTPVTSLDEWLDAVQECNLVPFMHGCPINLIYKVIEKFGNKFIYMGGYSDCLLVRQQSAKCLCLIDISSNTYSTDTLIEQLKGIGGFAGLSSMSMSSFSDSLIKAVKSNGFFLQYSSARDYPNALMKGVHILLADNWCNDNLTYRNIYRMKNDLSNITYQNVENGCPKYAQDENVSIPLTGIVGTNVRMLITLKGNININLGVVNYNYPCVSTDKFSTFEIGCNTISDTITYVLKPQGESLIRDIVIQES